MRPRRAVVALLVGCAALAGPAPACRAEWAPDGDALTLAPHSQSALALIPDGAGGALAAWVDARSGYNSDIFAERFTASGALASGWISNGKPITYVVCQKIVVAEMLDGAGGAYLVWSDNRCLPHRDIYATRITGAGASASGWPANGLGVCLASGDQDAPAIASDGAGGAFVVWEDRRAGPAAIYAARLTSAGALAAGWPADGRAIGGAGGQQTAPAIVADGAGGAIVVWQDTRSGNADLYALRIDGSGAPVAGWPAAGVAVSAAAGDQGPPQAIADGSGGVFVAWSDTRSGGADIYALRLTSAGAPAPGWQLGGTPVCTAAGDQLAPTLIPDGASGMIVAWQDARGADLDLYAARLTSAGALASGWTPGGSAVCTASGDQLAPVAAPDGSGGVYLAWEDRRADAGDIYGQRLTAAGAVAAGWSAAGLPLCTASGRQQDARIVSDGAGGALAAWTDARNLAQTDLDLYAQRLTPTGPVQTRAGGITANHHDGQTFLTWTCPPGVGWTYRVYASSSPIVDGASLATATLVGTLGDSTWYDRRLSTLLGASLGFHTDSAGPALAATRGLFVTTPGASGSTYYAVTVQLLTTPEDRAVTPGSNALAAPVAEQLGLPRPVYQLGLTLAWARPDIYTLWTTDRGTAAFPAMCNRPGAAFDCAVMRGGAAPYNSLLFNFHRRAGNFLEGTYTTGYPGEWVLSMDDPLGTRDQNSFWYGYDELYDLTLWQNPVPTAGVVCDYTERRSYYTLQWMLRNFSLDATRVYEYGFSMGAMGAFYFALHHPESIAALMPVCGNPDFSYEDDPNPSGFRVGTGLRDVCDRLWGTVPNDLPAATGGEVFQQLSGPWLVSSLGAVSMPPMVQFSGRNDMVMGWAVNLPLFAAVDQHRQPAQFFWDPRDHLGTSISAWAPMTVPTYLYRFRTNLSLPAFSNCSANDHPGDGTPASGDTVGTINGYADWDPAVVDEASRWEVTLLPRDLTTRWGPRPAPDSLTVDVTPRRLQAFPRLPGGTFDFRVLRLADSALVAGGSVLADSVGVITVPAVKVYRGGSRLHLEPRPTGLAVHAAGPGGALRILPLRNPVLGPTTVSLVAPRSGELRADLMDTAGRRVRSLLHAAVAAGTIRVPFPSAGLPSGVYFLTAELGGERAQRRVVLLR